MFCSRPRIWVTWPEAVRSIAAQQSGVAILGAAAEQGLGVDRLDRAVDLDVEIIGLDREARRKLGRQTAPNAPAFAGLRVEIGVAAGDHRQLRVELRVAAVGGDAVGDAIGATRPGRPRRSPSRGRLHFLVEARGRAEQFADAGRPEAFRPAAAEQQVLDRLPVDAGAEGRRRARWWNNRNSARRRSARGGGRRACREAEAAAVRHRPR